MKRKRGRYEPLVVGGLRPVLNRERWLLLQKNSAFWANTKKLRRKWRVPRNLDPYKDIQVIPFDTEIIDSEWFQSSGDANEMDKDMRAFLAKHELPYSFYDLIQYIILYNKLPSEDSPETREAIHDFGLPNAVIHDPSEIDRIPLTTADKRYIKYRVRERLGIKSGRPPKQYARALKQLDAVLSRRKNKSRRHRTLESAFKSMELKEQKYDNGDPRTFGDVVDETNSDFKLRSNFRLAVRRERQRVLRLKKRLNSEEK